MPPTLGKLSDYTTEFRFSTALPAESGQEDAEAESSQEEDEDKQKNSMLAMLEKLRSARKEDADGEE